jgi:hypothetical protein
MLAWVQHDMQAAAAAAAAEAAAAGFNYDCRLALFPEVCPMSLLSLPVHFRLTG